MNLKAVLCMAALVATSVTGFAAQVPGSLHFENADPADVLKMYSSLAGMELMLDPQVNTVHRPINLKTNGVTQAQAVALIKQALVDQAGITISQLDEKRAHAVCQGPLPSQITPNGPAPKGLLPTRTNDHANVLAEAVLRLLTTQDPERFADELSLPNEGNRRQVLESARQVLTQANRMGLAPTRIQFRLKDVVVPAMNTNKLPIKLPANAQLSLTGIKTVLLGETREGAQRDQSLRGEYELALGGTMDFPEGWRTFEGLRWSRVPEGVADPQTSSEMVLVSNIVSRVGLPIHAAADRSLLGLGLPIIRFLQERDPNIYANEAMRSLDQVWEALIDLTAHGIKDPPTRKDVEEGWNAMRRSCVESAEAVLAQAESLGIDFSTAGITLTDVQADSCYMRKGYGVVDGISASHLRFIFTVSSKAKSRNGRSIAGDYILATGNAQRTATRWICEDKIRWEKFPDDLLDEKGVADLKFETYVGEHGALPPGTAVPDAGFVLLSNGANAKLSDYRGKIVLLEWWATWCGPCQPAMAELQTFQQHHPEWAERVQFITLSIDDGKPEVVAHLAKKGWTNTLNAWAGPGGWVSAPAKQFRLHGVPTCYVIDPQGKVALAGFPQTFSITNTIAKLLQAGTGQPPKK